MQKDRVYPTATSIERINYSSLRRLSLGPLGRLVLILLLVLVLVLVGVVLVVFFLVLTLSTSSTSRSRYNDR